MSIILSILAFSFAAVALWGTVSEVRRGLSRDHRLSTLLHSQNTLERRIEAIDWMKQTQKLDLCEVCELDTVDCVCGSQEFMPPPVS